MIQSPTSHAVLIALCFLLLTTSTTLATPQLVLVQLIHRHGARSAITPANSSIICPRGCGLLTWDGADMLVKQGDYLRARYNGSRPEISPTIFFASPEFPAGLSYNVRHVYSRSTDLPRTLQSAAGLLKGMFPNSSEYFPAIHTVEFLQDQLLLIDVSPSYHIYQNLNNDINMARITAYAQGQFPSLDTVQQIALELDLGDYCAKPDNYASCVLGLQDIAATRNAEGPLPNVTATYYEQLNNCRRMYNSYFFPFNASNPVDVARGSLGQQVLQRMLDNMRRAMLPNNDSNALGFKLMHYSAHDTTVMPFVSTLGIQTDNLPLFGQLYLLDLLQDDITMEYYVRAAQSLPGQAPNTLHAVTESVLQLSCTSPNGTTYQITSLTGLCPFEDFERFINSTLPQSPQGACYLSPEAVQAIQCDTVGGDAPKSDSLCAFYRNYCPTFACPTGSTMSSSEPVCLPLSTIDGGQSVGVVVGACLGSAALALFIGLFVGRVLLRNRRLPGELDGVQYTPVSQS